MLILNDDLTTMYKDIIRNNEELKKGNLTEHEKSEKLKNLIL